MKQSLNFNQIRPRADRFKRARQDEKRYLYTPEDGANFKSKWAKISDKQISPRASRNRTRRERERETERQRDRERQRETERWKKRNHNSKYGKMLNSIFFYNTTF